MLGEFDNHSRFVSRVPRLSALPIPAARAETPDVIESGPSLFAGAMTRLRREWTEGEVPPRPKTPLPVICRQIFGPRETGSRPLLIRSPHRRRRGSVRGCGRLWCARAEPFHGSRTAAEGRSPCSAASYAMGSSRSVSWPRPEPLRRNSSRPRFARDLTKSNHPLR